MQTGEAKFWRDAWLDYDGLLDWLLARSDVRRVVEVGAGANPVLPLDVIDARGIQHAILDVSQDELDKAPHGYTKMKFDVMGSDPPLTGTVDLVASAFLAEHVTDAHRFHHNVRRMLRPGGWALHLFPTLYTVPFVVNRVIPETLSARMLAPLQRFRAVDGPDGKFPAHYRWCRGPTRMQRARLERVGFEIVQYSGYFGHGYYLHFPPLHRAEQAKARFLVSHPVAALTSYALVLLRRFPGAQLDPPDAVPLHPRSRTIVSRGTHGHIGADSS